MMVHLLSTKCVLGTTLDSCDASNYKRDKNLYSLGAYVLVEEIDKNCNKYIHRLRSIVIWVKESEARGSRV